LSIHQTKDGRIFVKYYIRNPETGKKNKEKREMFGRGQEAKIKAHERDTELKSKGEINPYTTGITKPTEPTFIQLTQEYVNSKQNTLPAVSIKNLWHKLTGSILPEIGPLPISRITHHRIDQYVTKRLKTPVTKRIGKGASIKIPVKKEDNTIKTISKTTVHRELSDIQAILNWSVNRKLINKNPIAGYAKPKRDDEIIMPPTADEIKKILKQAAPHLKRALLINYYSGVRPGVRELFSLQWHDVDMDKGLILIRSADKGGPVKRIISIHHELIFLLKKWKTEDKNNLHHYIIHYKNKPIKSLKSAFNSAKRRAGINRRLRMYDFRHKAITSILEEGGDLKSTSLIAGHSDTQMTTKIYQHITSALLKDTINRIPKIDSTD